MSCGLSGDLEDPRGAESGVSWTRFEPTLRQWSLYVKYRICFVSDMFWVLDALTWDLVLSTWDLALDAWCLVLSAWYLVA